jgi:cytochrome c5
MALLLAVILGAWLLTGCSKPGTPAAESVQPTTAKPEPTPAPPAADVKSSAPLTAASIFPAGPGKDLVLNTCGSCHPVACTAQGQRTAERWESLKNGHKDKLTSVGSADLETTFAYLKANFNESKPEPKIPPEFLQQGCPPF